MTRCANANKTMFTRAGLLFGVFRGAAMTGTRNRGREMIDKALALKRDYLRAVKPVQR